MGEGELAGVEGAEVRGVEHAGGGNVQEVEGAHTQGACVILGKGFSLLPPIINRDVARGQIAFFRAVLMMRSIVAMSVFVMIFRNA